jgi:hypothetical protein
MGKKKPGLRILSRAVEIAYSCLEAIGARCAIVRTNQSGMPALIRGRDNDLRRRLKIQ